MKSRVLTIQVYILFLLSITLIAQKDKLLKEKLNEIRGNVNKIVISTDNSEMIFNSDEAAQLFKRLKSKRIKKHIQWISEDDFDSNGEDVFVFKSKSGGKHFSKHNCKDMMIFKHGNLDDLDLIEENKTIKINVEEEDGNKKVTVTTIEDGETTVEKYVGDKADKYLENEDDDNENIKIIRKKITKKVKKN